MYNEQSTRVSRSSEPEFIPDKLRHSNDALYWHSPGGAMGLKLSGVVSSNNSNKIHTNWVNISVLLVDEQRW